MTVTAEPGLAGLQARTQAELAPRLMAQLQRLNWDAERLAAHQAERLRALLARAIQGSPFHARPLGHIDPAPLELADLRRLPTMTKAEMMASFDEVVTDRRRTRRRVEDHLRGGGRQAALLLGDYVCLTTGGSSGQRGVFVQTIGEYADMAVSLRRNTIARLLTAGRSPDGMVIAMVAAAAPVHTSGFVAAATGGGPVRMVPVPDPATPITSRQRHVSHAKPAHHQDLCKMDLR
jgi:phenylacetate-CoA ligase